MKKLIAVAVVLALVTGVAFADTSIGGGLGIQVETIKGNNVRDGDNKATKPQGGLNFKEAKVDFNFSSEKYGGRVRLFATPFIDYWMGYSGSATAGQTDDATKSNGVPVLDADGNQKQQDGKDLWYTGSYSASVAPTGSPFAFVWWKPVNIFRLQVGQNKDGDFGTQKLGGWGMNGGAQSYVATDNDSFLIPWSDMNNNGYLPWRVARSAGYYGGYGGVGAWLSIYPVDIVDINVLLPYNSRTDEGGSRNVADIFMDFDVNVVFRLAGIGQAAVSFDSKNSTNNAGYTIGSPGTLWASFFFNGSESLNLDVGFGYFLPWTDAGADGKSKDIKTRSDGFSIGLGAQYTSGDFRLRARVGSTLGKVNSKARGGDATAFGIGLLPSYNFGSFRGFFNTGFGVEFPQEFIGKRIVAYYVNPYVQVPAGGLTFFAGVKLEGYFWTYSVDNMPSDTRVDWAVPIGITVGF